LFQNLIEDAQRASAVNHEIFRYDFEPIHDGFARKNMVVMGGTQTDSDSVIRVAVKAIGRHLRLRWLTRKDDADKYRGPVVQSGPQHQTPLF
jgi:hypothetical protein